MSIMLKYLPYPIPPLYSLGGRNDSAPRSFLGKSWVAACLSAFEASVQRFTFSTCCVLSLRCFFPGGIVPQMQYGCEGELGTRLVTLFPDLDIPAVTN